MKKTLSRHPYSNVFILLLFPALLFLTASNIQAADGTGTIQGSIKSPYIHRYPALIYIDHADGTFLPPKDKVHISQKDLVFSPRINPILNGTTIDFTNDDSVMHNVFSAPGSASGFNLGNYGQGIAKSYTFNNLGPSTLLCSVHPEMVAFVVVLQNPYYVVSNDAGDFKIDNVPPGTYQLKFWNEKLDASPQSVIVAAGKTVPVTFGDIKKKE
jgi:plastocyanin